MFARSNMRVGLMMLLPSFSMQVTVFVKVGTSVLLCFLVVLVSFTSI